MVNGKQEMEEPSVLVWLHSPVDDSRFTITYSPLTELRMQCRYDCFTHLLGADFFHACFMNVGCTQSLLEYTLHGRLYPRSSRLLTEGITHHHRGRQNGGQRIGNVAPGNVGRGAV